MQRQNAKIARRRTDESLANCTTPAFAPARPRTRPHRPVVTRGDVAHAISKALRVARRQQTTPVFDGAQRLGTEGVSPSDELTTHDLAECGASLYLQNPDRWTLHELADRLSDDEVSVSQASIHQAVNEQRGGRR